MKGLLGGIHQYFIDLLELFLLIFVPHKGLDSPDVYKRQTLFYVLGGVLVVGAGVLLVVKRRVGTENKEE